MIAVVGLDALLPGSDGAEAWIATDSPAFREVPEGRWPAVLPIAPAGTSDTVTTRVGAFVDGPERDAAGRDVLFDWVARVVAGCLPSGVDRRRTSLDLAALMLPSTGHARALSGTGHPDDLRQAELPARLAADAAGLGGAVETLDAACASGLFALARAVGRLRRGEVSCAIAAAVNRSDSSYLFQGFGQLHASSPTGRSRPFDAAADGLLIGEGAVGVALMRLEEARALGLRVHAVVRGVGLGSDGRKGNMLAPAQEGELRAMRAAWHDAGLDPATVGYVECHATGTAVGDRTELQALSVLLAGRRTPAVLASAKALIGHTVTAAGLAGFVRAVGAVRDGFFPPAVGLEQPRAELAASPVLTTVAVRTPWTGARRAAVSAFGFGGTNAHVVLDGPDTVGTVALPPALPDLVVVAAHGQVGPHRGAALWEALRHGAPLGALGALRPDPSRVRVPPIELAQWSRQQWLPLTLAMDLLSEHGVDPERTAVVVAIEVDPTVSAAVRRTTLRATGRSAEADRADPPLTTERVSGSLPNFVANRLSAQLDLRGPSYVVGGGAEAGSIALSHAAALLAGGQLDAVLVGAVDTESGPRGGGDEGAVVMLVRAAPASGVATLSPTEGKVQGGGFVAGGLVELMRGLALDRPTRTSGWAMVPRSAFAGDWSAETVPRPIPVRDGRPPAPGHAFRGPAPTPSAGLAWEVSSTRPVAHPPPDRGVAAVLEASRATTGLADALARAVGAVGTAHARWLEAQRIGLEGLAALTSAPRRSDPNPLPPRPDPPRAFDRAALLRHAGGRISEVFGDRWADLDAFEPRVRMPLPPLLLCDRVITVEGERGGRGPARIVTEYDVPRRVGADGRGPDWTADGRPPAFVVVESGQADLFLVSFLGIDQENKGERVYRLLDCDLEFQGPRPEPGETLRHDIRIDRFARLGATTLFYFRYDCTEVASGRPVLRMRNGCAGFFTPAELRTPRGLLPDPPLPAARPCPPLLCGAPTSLDGEAVEALADGRFSSAFGPAFAPADGSALRLPPDPAWRLVHRVPSLSLSGGAAGLGEVRFEQDLRDDDWFNACHFQGDPCMPGTLMYEGCLQAVQLWLLAAGVAATHPTGRFEPLAGLATKLRCRGQVVPGHQKLTYRARIKQAAIDEDAPWAVADVTLSVDGVPVVSAVDVGVRVEGPRTPLRTGPVVPRDRVLEFSVGSAVRAFGQGYAAFDGPGRRCARMPGPPLAQLTEVLEVEGAAGEVAAPRSVTIAYDVPRDAWFWRAAPGGAMPWVILLETALQPCGWLTAWQGAGILGGADLYFRNLGGRGVQHLAVGPDTGRLCTTARQVSVSASGGMQVQRFEVEVRAGDALVFSCDTQFGYFTAASLRAQKGLPGVGDEPEANVDRALAGHPALPRDDLRMLDRVTFADPTGGVAGLGRYVARKDVDPQEWFFTAHFWLDPVMPGSLGLEALQQLARWVFRERTGVDAATDPLPLGREVRWTYRGQVLATHRAMTLELEVLELGVGAMRCSGVVRADGLPIYRFEDFGIRVSDPPAPPRPRPAESRAAALLDAFERVDADQAIGRLRLDDRHPWLDAHRPTLAAAAVPLAFSIEIAAEAAVALVPGASVRGIPSARAERWIHTGEGPVDLTVAAVRDGETVAVNLFVRGEVGARVVVSLGRPDRTPMAPPPAVVGDAVSVDGPTFFAAGHTFHGPVLQAMTRLEQLGPDGAVATLTTRPDSEVSGISLPFVLDPLLLDAATHPMMSGSPERWVPELPAGRLAYPVACEDLVVRGPRPTGDVRCTVVRRDAGPRRLAFDVRLDGAEGCWVTYRWVEVLVPGGPLLGRPPAIRRAFLWEGVPVPSVVIGRPIGDRGWEVRRVDVVEPIPGTLAAIYGAPRAAHPLRELAVREAVRRHLGGAIHPKDLSFAELRPGILVVTEAPTLDAAAYVRSLHPTRVRVHLVEETEQNCIVEVLVDASE